MSKEPPPRGAKRPGPTPLLSDAECREVATAFDGTTPTINALLARWQLRYLTLRRHNIIKAARRGGYTTAAARRRWTKSEDRFLRKNWQHLSGDEIAAALWHSLHAVSLRRRRRRLAIGPDERSELSLRAIETLTGLDHHQWMDLIEHGWLKARCRKRRPDAVPVVSVSVPRILALLRQHPEVYAYGDAPVRARQALELDRLPDPPGWKRVVCYAAVV